MTSNAVRSADGTLIAYDAVGPENAPVIIRVDGAATFRALDPGRDEFTANLRSQFQIVSYDRRGRGESEDSPIYSIDKEVEDVSALLERFGGHGYVLGLSSGAVLALRCAAAGLPIDGLAAYEPPFIVSPDRDPVTPDYVNRVQGVVADGRPGEAVRIFMTEAVGMPSAAVQSMTELPFWPALAQIGHTIAYDGHIMGGTMSGNPNELDAFTNVEVPALVMCGAASEEWLHEAAIQLVQRLPSGTIQVLPGQTHQVDPAVLAQAVGSYFTSLQAGVQSTS